MSKWKTLRARMKLEDDLTRDIKWERVEPTGPIDVYGIALNIDDEPVMVMDDDQARVLANWLLDCIESLPTDQDEG